MRPFLRNLGTKAMHSRKNTLSADPGEWPFDLEERRKEGNDYVQIRDM